MKYLPIIILMLSLFSCKAKSDASLVNNSKLQLVKLGDAVAENSKTKNIAGYKIEKNIKLSKAQQAALLKEINNPSNIEHATRRCAFEPVYAVVVNKQVIALFDIEFCPKIQLAQKDDKILDLKQNNALKDLILNIEKK